MFCLYFCWFNISFYIHLCCIHEICFEFVGPKVAWKIWFFRLKWLGGEVSSTNSIGGWDCWENLEMTQDNTNGWQPTTLLVLCSSQFIIQELTVSMVLILFLSPHVPSGNHSSMVSWCFMYRVRVPMFSLLVLCHLSYPFFLCSSLFPNRHTSFVWWFQRLFMFIFFTPTWRRFPFWLAHIFHVGWVKTTK